MNRYCIPRNGLKLLLTAVYTVTAAGIPLPSVSRPQASPEAYPCATSGCGCSSAEACWRSCCCHTLAERLEWARKTGVRPPPFAIAEANRAGFDLGWLAALGRHDYPAGRATCCASKPGAAAASTCCQRAADCEPAARSCCAKQSQRSVRPPQGNGIRHIVAWLALKCGGQSMNWLAAMPSVVVAKPEFTLEPPVIAWLGPAKSDDVNGSSRRPAIPPPRGHVALTTS